MSSWWPIIFLCSLGKNIVGHLTSRLPCCVFLDLCIYTAGGGNPLYREELLKQCSSVKNKAIGLIFFAELESCMHKADVKANK